MIVRYLSVLLLFLTSFGPAWAGSGGAADAAATSKPPEIVLDHERNEIRFVIDGRVAAVMDANGMRVRESIEYGGMLTDTGTAHYDKQLPGANGAGDEE